MCCCATVYRELCIVTCDLCIVSCVLCKQLFNCVDLLCGCGLQWADKVYARHTPAMIWPTRLLNCSNISFNLFQSFGPCNLTHCKATRLKIWQKVLTVFISRVWRSPMVSLSSSLTKEIPKIFRQQIPNCFKEGNSIPFLENRPFSAGLCVIKGRSQLKWGKVKLRSCKSERIVPIWGVVRKSKCQLGRKSGVSERRNPFLGF